MTHKFNQGSSGVALDGPTAEILAVLHSLIHLVRWEWAQRGGNFSQGLAFMNMNPVSDWLVASLKTETRNEMELRRHLYWVCTHSSLNPPNKDDKMKDPFQGDSGWKNCPEQPPGRHIEATC